MSKMNKTPKTPTIVRNNPIAAATISKLNKSKKDHKPNPVTANIPDVSSSVRERIKNNENIAQLFPDIELSIQILTSSILSPNDMITTNLLYQSPEIKLPGDVRATMVDTIKKHIKTNYNLEDNLTTILRESLFTKGSYVEAIIPEAAIDDIINPVGSGEVSIESFESSFKNLDNNKYNFLSNETHKTDNVDITVSNESFISVYQTTDKKELTPSRVTGTSIITLEDLGIDVTDNPSVLSKSLVKDIFRKEKINSLYYSNNDTNLTTEDSNVTEDDLDSFFKDSSKFKQKEYVAVKTRNETSRKSVGKPLVMHLPTESVIPVHVMNNPEKHLGYFVLLDDNGIPVDTNTELKKKENDIQNLINNNDTKLNIISKAKKALSGITKKDVKLNNLESMYSDIAEKMLKRKLANGLYSEVADIKDNADIYRVMLLRALKAQHTSILFLPAEVVAYYAFDYRDNGTGKSLLEKVSMLFSIRSILLFSKLMANIKNSITVTEVSATLDDDDIDPEKTMEKIISESLKTRQTHLPLGVTKIDDLTDWVHKVGFKYNFKHPGLPNMELETSDTQTSKVIPDSDLDDHIEEMIIMSFGLTPEIVKAGYNEDFATTVMSKNLLLTKRVTQMQAIFNPLITKHVHCFLKSDMILRNKLQDIIKSNIKSIKSAIKKQKTDEHNINYDKISDERLITYILKMFETELTVSLPTPELSEAQAMKDSFEVYKDALDDYLELFVSSDALPDEIMGEMSDKLDSVKSVMKTILIKKWMGDNGYMPEISEFLSLDDEGKPVFDILAEYTEYSDALSKSLLPFLKRNKRFVSKLDDKLDKIENAEDTDEDANDDNNSDADVNEDTGNDSPDTENSDAVDNNIDDSGDVKDDDTEDPNEDTVDGVDQ